MIVSVLIPRFSLVAAMGGRRKLLHGAVALAPQPGGSQAIGETSGPAEAFGIRPGMPLGEALARCPELMLVTPDAERTESAWEELVRRLEGLGAAVESERAGEAFFEANGLKGLWGGHLEGLLGHLRRALGSPAKVGAAPARFTAYAAATTARARPGRGARGATIVPPGAARAFLAPLPVGLLEGHLEAGRNPATADAGASSQGFRSCECMGASPPRPPSGRPPPAGAEHVAGMISDLERLGVRTLGELEALPRGMVADRFGTIGVRAHELAGGDDRPLRPRRCAEEVSDSLELPEAASGGQLEQALSLLIDRLLAHPRRRGRSFRTLRVTARLAAGGGWRSDVTLRLASAEPERLRLAVLPRLAELPGPARWLGLRALVLGPSRGDQPALSRDPRERRRERLAEAVRQARAAGGRDAVLRVLDVDPRSRVPERRAILTPFPEP